MSERLEKLLRERFMAPENNNTKTNELIQLLLSEREQLRADLAAAKAETAKLSSAAQAVVDTLKEQTCIGHHPEDAYIFVEDVVVVMNALVAALTKVKP